MAPLKKYRLCVVLTKMSHSLTMCAIATCKSLRTRSFYYTEDQKFVHSVSYFLLTNLRRSRLNLTVR